MYRSVLLLITVASLTLTAWSDDYLLSDAYHGLRTRALELDAETVEPQDGMIALLMETGYDEAVATVLATSDGGASIYFSNGGGLLGAGEYEQVRNIVFEILTEAKRHVENLSSTEEYPLPSLGETRFYLVTEQGVLTASSEEERLGNNKHELSPLFHQVHKLISYIGAVQEDRSN